LYEIAVEWFVYHKPKKKTLLIKTYTKKDLYIFLSLVVGALLTYYLNHDLGLGAVVASSLIGLIGGLLVKEYAVPIYCGSFAGMVSAAIIQDFSGTLLVAVFAGLLYVLGQETFKGFGGKLGATAYFGTLFASFIADSFNDTMVPTDVSLQTDVFIIFILGGIASYLIKEQIQTGAVVSSALLGLIGGLILPSLFDNGSALAVALFCGTFVGMSTTSKLSTRISVLIATFIGAVVFSYTAPYFAGLGGKLGLIAFGASITTSGFYNLRNHIIKSSKKNRGD
jgi:hypothetical protein